MSVRHSQLALKLAPPFAFPAHGIIGLLLISLAWPASWLHAGFVGQHSFFPLWLGFILVVDALVLRRKGTSLLTRRRAAFVGLFVMSVPLWWALEGINKFTQNWHYIGAEEYSPLQYVLVASWHFSVVIPAVLEAAELVGSLGLMRRFQQGPVVRVSRPALMTAVVLGVVSLVALVIWPRYTYPVTWLCLFLVLDPINYHQGRPSVTAWLARGDWRLVVALAAGALICGWFWEMWNYWAMPKWQYTISFVDFARVFEMPLLGYGGYLPFGLEVYASYHFLAGLLGRVPEGYVQIVKVSDSAREGRTARGVG